MQFNPWGLNKNLQLKALMVELVSRYGDEGMQLSGRWQSDHQAVGLAKSGASEVIAYVHVHGQRRGRFGLHLEYPDDLGSMIAYEDATQEQVMELISAHLDLWPLDEKAENKPQRTF